MLENPLTELETTQAKLAAARERRRAAARREAVLARAVAAVDRRLAAQQKITLGAALLRAAEHEPRALPGLRRLLAPHITRDVDRACLRGTPFALDSADSVAAPAAEPAQEA
jgi:hypothetical protein